MFDTKNMVWKKKTQNTFFGILKAWEKRYDDLCDDQRNAWLWFY